MGKRDLSLTPRIEDKRDKKAITPPVHFRLSEIKQHFDESMQSVKEQFTVADNLLSEGNTEGCQIIWRSQIVFAESLLDFFLHEMSKYCLFRMFTGEWEKSEKYKNLEVKMSKVEEGLAAKESDEWFFIRLRCIKKDYISNCICPCNSILHVVDEFLRISILLFIDLIIYSTSSIVFSSDIDNLNELSANLSDFPIEVKT